MTDYEDEEPEGPECPYCEAMGWCEHQVMDVDETFGEVQDFGVYKEALDMLIKTIADVVRSERKLPERLKKNRLARFMPFDPGDRPEPSEEAVRDWLLESDGWHDFREHYEELLNEAGAAECDYYPPACVPGTASYCRSYHAGDPEKVCAAVIEVIRKDLKAFECAG